MNDEDGYTLGDIEFFIGQIDHLALELIFAVPDYEDGTMLKNDAVYQAYKHLKKARKILNRSINRA